MVKCCVPRCSNRSQKGVTFKIFPKEPKLRKQWKLNIGRVNWEPTQNSVVCEKHFASNMWEKLREDGKKKLKYNACPTLFVSGINENSSFEKTNTKIEAPFYTLLIQVSNNNSNVAIIEDSNAEVHLNDIPDEILQASENDEVHLNDISDEIEQASENDEVHLNDISDEIEQASENENLSVLDNFPPSAITSNQRTNNLPISSDTTASKNFQKSQNPDAVDWERKCKEFEAANKILEEKLLKADRILKRLQSLQHMLLLKNENFRNKLSQIKNSKNPTLQVAITKVFNDDQLNVIINGGKKWTVETLRKAVKLRLACGATGYQELQNQNFPLPSERTLRRRRYLVQECNTPDTKL